MSGALTERAAGKAARMAFVDNIRWTVIAMVVLIHACVTYSGLGSWYYYEKGALDVASKLVFAGYEIFSQAFFMGLLFFIAALFVPGAYERKGLGRFVTDRLVRLGVPTLVYMLVLHPLTMAILAAGRAAGPGQGGFAGWYASSIAGGRFLGESGPLWFAFALLGFSVVYGLARWAADRLIRPAESRGPARALSPRAVHLGAIVLIPAMALLSFAVRLVQPIGTAWMNMQLCFFPQYVVLFAAGLWAARAGLLRALPAAAGRTWLRLALALGVPAWFLLLGLGGALSGSEAAFAGGWRWQAAAFAAWEAFFCVSFSLGLITLFRERADARTPATGLLADTCFGIYVFHAPVLVAASMAIRGLAFHPLAKALLAGAAAWLATLAVAWLVRRIPVVGRLFA